MISNHLQQQNHLPFLETILEMIQRKGDDLEHVLEYRGKTSVSNFSTNSLAGS